MAAEPETVSDVWQNRLRDRHPHERDAHIRMDDATHTYFVDGHPVGISGSKLYGDYFPSFDGPAAAHAMLANRHFPRSANHAVCRTLPIWQRNGQPIEVWSEGAQLRDDRDEVVRHIVAVWAVSNGQAADDGREVHLECERLMNGCAPVRACTEVAYAQQFLDECRQDGWVPFRSEWTVYTDPQYDVAGTIDVVLYQPEHEFDAATGKRRLRLADWKRCKKFREEGFRGETGVGLCAALANCEYSKYSLQLHIYRWILERYYDVTVVDSFIVVVHPHQARVLVRPALPLADVVETMFAERAARQRAWCNLSRSVWDQWYLDADATDDVSV